MTEQEQIRAIAELDGKKVCDHSPEHWDRRGTDGDSELYCNACEEYLHNMRTKPYLTSRDAIVPVIEKQPAVIKDKISHEIRWEYGTTVGFLFPLLLSPVQLCEALLRATGKWKP